MTLASQPDSKPASGVATPANAAAVKPPKQSIHGRITRMFSSAAKSKEGEKAGAGKSESLKSGKPDGQIEKANSDSDSSGASFTQSAPKPRMVRRESKANGYPRQEDKALQRFEILPAGGHAHHLKSAKRQEKLSDMLRDLLGGGRKRDEHDPDRLSLVSNWADQLRSEKDKLAPEKKGGPNATASLVEKYGKCQEVIGRGAFGIVRISHKVDPKNGHAEQLYAVKEFRRKPQESDKKYKKRLTSEFCISSSLSHPNVIRTLDLLTDAKGDYCEVMEFCAGGDLYSLILSVGHLEVAEADCYFKQLMRGVDYMHDMGVAHRDLKPENLLLTTHGALKITDFGNGECFRMAWESEAHLTGGLCGSAPYIAPEEYTEKEFDPRAVDIWATGVIYMAMRTGRHLWRVAKRDEDEFFEKYLEGRKDEDGYPPIETLKRVSYPTSSLASRNTNGPCKARCRNVIYSILDPNPTRRITAGQVLKSEWGRDIVLCKAGEEGL
ncbi:serine/threonine-protein kinase hal4 [Ascobolus immersus RN42]|uniref:non-specific serine/threonine protein kinase n=1 Tax=Ascobolus immersus RN42 TaxID=1160509 RepID=A0A3N4II48_ASCIM|nr:serine/threonine-protein kinase hal4 [Ascobolus immersus RN42]